MDHWTALGAIKPVMAANPDVILVSRRRQYPRRHARHHRHVAATPPHRLCHMGHHGHGHGLGRGSSRCHGQERRGNRRRQCVRLLGHGFQHNMPFQAPRHRCDIQQRRHLQRHRREHGRHFRPAPTTLDVRARYDKLGDAFGAATYYVTTPKRALKGSHRAIASRKPALIDVQLAADSGKESGHIGYLNPAALETITV